jgi:hypothetical protein
MLAGTAETTPVVAQDPADLKQVQTPLRGLTAALFSSLALPRHCPKLFGARSETLL